MNTFYHGDCLFVLKHDIPPESVDLIYLDPPFFTGKVQKGTMKWQPGAMEVSYEDSRRFWSEKADLMREQSPAWLRHIALKRPDFASYLWYMMERLQACQKVLKKTGSMYLHCDYRASHYLKMIMDDILGERNFRNEIIWFYPFAGRSKSVFPRKHDTLFWYSKSASFVFNSDSPLVRVPITDKSVVHNYRYVDEHGRRYRADPRKSGKTYRYYLDQGKLPEDVWTDIHSLHFELPERTGYPTQKPEKLLERIIGAHTEEGDLVLDPFCGCGTTVIVASKQNRRFIGIDIHPTAFEVIRSRGHELFARSRYISRDLEEVSAMNPREFESWVNEFFRATKPSPDRGVDGITHDGTPIQVKTFTISYNVLSQFITDVKYHPNTAKPVKKVTVVSQTGFDDGARKRQFEIETAEGIEVVLTTPEQMLTLDA